MSDPVETRPDEENGDAAGGGTNHGRQEPDARSEREPGAEPPSPSDRDDPTEASRGAGDPDLDLDLEEGIELTRKPTVASSAAALVAALVATLAAGLVSVTAVAIGVGGVVLLGAALAVGHRGTADAGAVLVFAGVLAAGVGGGAPAVEPTLVGAVATVLAWDRAQAAIDLGEQLGRESRTLRLEAVGLASSLVVGLASATVGYGIYVVGSGGQPVSALVLLLLAAVLLTVGLGSKRKRGGKWGSSRRGPRRR
ncbi:hypothetical protein SAMN05444422_109113 [Halobiforma haloterrestris]|uniref:Uncharacterized protein n=1 Tax=Natronobacterium haloterrestre TaxID=148448 RepID=A0A1I1JNX7_NATHA|nr:hypothetical protein [Halobiforma haloterrestris]SFC50254.1 hypothetical protein SAMN05444422_109113 [Halobiforma haloterrestris]